MNMQELKAMYGKGEDGRERSYRLHMDTDPVQLEKWNGSDFTFSYSIPTCFIEAVAILRVAGINNPVLGIGVQESENQFALYEANDTSLEEYAKIREQGRVFFV